MAVTRSKSKSGKAEIKRQRVIVKGTTRAGTTFRSYKKVYYSSASSLKEAHKVIFESKSSFSNQGKT
jgi:hypothetical protein